ncbi:tRNA- family protein, partial [Vibrio parahaemolyticus IDH02640]
HRSSLM